MPFRPHRAAALALLAALAATAEESRPWSLPEPVLAAQSRRAPIPIELARAASGATGVFVFEKDAGLALHVSKGGKGPWKALMLPLGLAGDARVEGARVEVLLTDLEAKEGMFAAFDLDRQEELERVTLPRPLAGPPFFPRLLADGRRRQGLFFCEGGEVQFSASEDGGKRWTAPRTVAATARHDDSITPPLFRTSKGLLLVLVDAGGALAQLQSADAGETWEAQKTPPAVAGKHGKPILVSGAQSGNDLHLVVLTSSGRYVYLLSGDEGAHWQGATVLAATRLCDLACVFQVRARGRTVALSFTDAGASDLHPHAARLLVSRKAGNEWTESPVAAGISGDSGFAAVWIAEDETLTAALARVPAEGKSGTSFVLLRTELPAGGAGPEWPEGQAAPEWWAGGR